jgi:nucleoside-diphosphate-sugar epimerase
MKFQRIAITGGGGRLGRFVVAECASHAAVTVLDLKPGDSGHPFVALDVLDLDAVRRALNGHDAVIHLAAIDDAIEAPQKAYFETNVEGTFNVLQAAHELGITRAVIASSTSALGLGDDKPDYMPRYYPIDEAHPLTPHDAYSLSKQVNEVVARSFALRGITRIACLRPTLIVRHEVVAEVDNMAKLDAGDPAGDPNFHLSNVAEPFSEALPLQRSYVMPEDVARCFRLALEADDPPPLDIFIVAAGDTIGQVDSLAHIECRLGHLAEVRKPDLYRRDPTASLLDSSHALEALGWRAEGTWADVVAKYGG